jgi:hypothetical protein
MRAVMLALGAGAMLTPILFWHRFHAAAPGTRGYSLVSLLCVLGVLVCAWLAGRPSAARSESRGMHRLGRWQRLLGTLVVAALALACSVRDLSGSLASGGLSRLVANQGVGLLLGLALSLPGWLVLLPLFVLRHRQAPRPSGARSLLRRLPADGLSIAGALLALGVYASLQGLMARLSAQVYGCADVAWETLPACYVAVPALLLAAWLPPRGHAGHAGHACIGRPVPVSGV